MQCNRHYILVIDFGSQYTQLLLRRIRELGVYSELYNWNINECDLFALKPNGIILSGGPNSVTGNEILSIPKCIFQLGIPILGICYGMQIMAALLGGVVKNFDKRGEFGYSSIEIVSSSILINNIFDYMNQYDHAILDVWMSHNDIITTVPNDFKVIGITEYNQVAIIANEKHHWYGVQFHPEVTHTKTGKHILKRFIIDICQCVASWNPINIIDDIVAKINKIVGQDKVILAFSGGIDSVVTALLLQIAIGNRFICIFVDTGLLGCNESNRVQDFYKCNYNLNIVYIAEKQRFLNALIGIQDPEEKRRIIGKTFIEVFEAQIHKFKHIKWLAQGTIYSDVIESGLSDCVSSQVIKSHHNVGGLPNSINIQLLEPIRHLFKDEVRNIGSELGLPQYIIHRYPFPGPGMAIRILGEVKEQYCQILRKVDHIFLEELNRDHFYNQLSQAFAVFLPIHSVGVQGDKRTYKWVIALRAIETVDFMTARWARLPYDFLDKVSNRIVNEVSEVSRVVYDISSKPPATIEWE